MPVRMLKQCDVASLLQHGQAVRPRTLCICPGRSVLRTWTHAVTHPVQMGGRADLKTGRQGRLMCLAINLMKGTWLLEGVRERQGETYLRKFGLSSGRCSPSSAALGRKGGGMSSSPAPMGGPSDRSPCSSPLLPRLHMRLIDSAPMLSWSRTRQLTSYLLGSIYAVRHRVCAGRQVLADNGAQLANCRLPSCACCSRWASG